MDRFPGPLSEKQCIEGKGILILLLIPTVFTQSENVDGLNVIQGRGLFINQLIHQCIRHRRVGTYKDPAARF